MDMILDGPTEGDAGPTSITLTPADWANLLTTGKWGRLIAIVGLVCVGLGLLTMAGFGAYLTTQDALVSELTTAGGVLGVYILMLAFYIYPLIKLFQFSNKIITAFEQGSGVLASEAFSALKALYKFMGILTLATIGLYILGMILAAVGTIVI